MSKVMQYSQSTLITFGSGMYTCATAGFQIQFNEYLIFIYLALQVSPGIHLLSVSLRSGFRYQPFIVRLISLAFSYQYCQPTAMFGTVAC